MHQQYDHIRQFYGQPGPEWFVERPYPYLNESTMTRIVEDTVRATIMICDKIKYTDIGGLESSIELLPPELVLPYAAPL